MIESDEFRKHGGNKEKFITHLENSQRIFFPLNLKI